MKMKASVVMVIFMLLMSLLPMNALANGTAEANSGTKEANGVLSSYLLATQKGDIKQMVALSNDLRVSSASIVDFYTEILNKQSEQLADYKILSQEVLSPTSYKFITELTFKNGDSSQVPFTLSNDSGQWKVILTPNSLEDPKYKVIKGENLITGVSPKTPTAPTTTSQKLVSPMALTPLCDWSITGLTSTVYSTASFNVNSVYSQVLVQGGQAPSYGYYFTPNISYAVVQPHTFGDTVWGYLWHSGTGTYSFVINGQSLTFSNAKMRLSMNFTGDKADAAGKVYNN